MFLRKKNKIMLDLYSYLYVALGINERNKKIKKSEKKA